MRTLGRAPHTSCSDLRSNSQASGKTADFSTSRPPFVSLPRARGEALGPRPWTHLILNTKGRRALAPRVRYSLEVDYLDLVDLLEFEAAVDGSLRHVVVYVQDHDRCLLYTS